MRKHAKHYHAHVNSFLEGTKKVYCVHVKGFFFIIFFFRDSVCCHFE